MCVVLYFFGEKVRFKKKKNVIVTKEELFLLCCSDTLWGCLGNY